MRHVKLSREILNRTCIPRLLSSIRSPSSRDSREQLINYVDRAYVGVAPFPPPHLLFMFIVFLSARRSERILTGQVARLVKSQIKIEQTLNEKDEKKEEKALKIAPMWANFELILLYAKSSRELILTAKYKENPVDVVGDWF